MAHYSAAKHGLIGLMRSMANELAADLIRVNAVCPTSVDTPMANYPAIWKLFRPDLENPQGEDARGGFAKMNLLPISLIEPRDISAACLYLASEDSRYVTGHALPVDAGNIALFGLNPTVLAEIES
jgi:NAD(P)-dependent dehydrogenase (short-subunit alcohol dehydrogenase family)